MSIQRILGTSSVFSPISPSPRHLIMFGFPPGPFPRLTNSPMRPPLFVITLGGFDGLGHSLTFDTVNNLGNKWVLYSELITLLNSFDGLERTDLTVKLVVSECNGLESTVKTGILMLNLTRTLIISLCT